MVTNFVVQLCFNSLNEIQHFISYKTSEKQLLVKVCSEIYYLIRFNLRLIIMLVVTFKLLLWQRENFLSTRLAQLAACPHQQNFSKKIPQSVCIVFFATFTIKGFFGAKQLFFAFLQQICII